MTSAVILNRLRTYESRNVTFMDPDGSWPIVWDRAQGTTVWDVEGRRYLDLTAAFGVANAGHANAHVVQAARKQLARLLHAMGDVHPHRLKADLARELSRLTFERWTQLSPGKTRHSGKTIFCSSGFEAVEAALKTAFLATGRPGVIAFQGGYHGLGYGALNVTHRSHFRDPFRRQLREFGHFLPFPTQPGIYGKAPAAVREPSPRELAELKKQLRHRMRRHAVGAVLVEPIQARGGIRAPLPGFLPLLRQVCDESGAMLILDEIYTGFGRTGKWFAAEHWEVVPDVICLGKALTGGFPLAACVGRADLMDRAWPASTGEAIHTSTFLGHPVGCAMALAQLREIRRRKLPEHSARLGRWLAARLARIRITRPGLQGEVRGQGLMVGLALRRTDGRPAGTEVLAVVKQMLRLGFILLPEGEAGDVLGFTPPLIIQRVELERAARALEDCLQ